MARLQQWTDNEDTYLVVALERQIPLLEIVATLERTESAVRARIQRLGYTRSDTLLEDLLTKIRVLPESKFKAGYHEDLGVTVRSGWEASVLRWLNHKGIAWEYEPRRFYFPEERGRRSYLPDLWLPDYMEGKWVEIKGSLRIGDQTKTRRFKKHYPEEFARLMVITANEKAKASIFYRKMEVPVLAFYDDLDKACRGVIPGWGGGPI